MWYTLSREEKKTPLNLSLDISVYISTWPIGKENGSYARTHTENVSDARILDLYNAWHGRSIDAV